ncbi:immunoglobulin domain-containing protein [Opitutus terrae]|uniref:immunoglobulin domain-containing protein n=1 Tax=Opitutus terrae TaxID=107709 RepID=UPI0002D8EA90|nr:immunoglobulin domain-containing protein [Opitutus terrae]
MPRVRRWLVLAVTASGLFTGTAPAAPIWDFPQPHPVGDPNVATSVVLRSVIGVYDAAPPPATITVPVTGSVNLSVPLDDREIAAVSWFKDGERLAATGRTLALTKLKATDSGLYTATVQRTVESPMPYSSAFETIRLEVGNPTSCKLVNISSRTTISPANPTLIVGFVVGGSDRITPLKHLLIRAVGPSLVGVGVPQTLAAPQVTLYDARGQKIEWPDVWIPEWDPYRLASVVAPIIGAMPLLPGAQDFAILYSLAPGAYTAHVSSRDGGSGDVLFEVYEVPAELIPVFGEETPTPPKS